MLPNVLYVLYEVNTNHRRTMVGWGTRTEDRCWYRDDVLQFEEDEKKKKEETAGKAPNPAWGTEKMRSKSVQEEVSKTGLKDPEAKAQVDVV